MDELKEAEVTFKGGSSIVMQEYKNLCQVNYTGELKGLQSNTDYTLWVAEATSSGDCPDMSAEPKKLESKVSPYL